MLSYSTTTYAWVQAQYWALLGLELHSLQPYRLGLQPQGHPPDGTILGTSEAKLTPLDCQVAQVVLLCSLDPALQGQPHMQW